MRVTFVGASPLAVQAAEMLIDRGHEVVIVDPDQAKVDLLSDRLDCSFLVGDGSRPAVLQDVAPERSDVLFCVSDRDEVNILAALVGRSLGFDRVVPKVEDPELEMICTELGLDDVIIPDQEVARQLLDLAEGRDSPDLANTIRSGLRFFGFTVPDGIGDAPGLDLPRGTRLIACTRGNRSVLIDDDARFERGDRVLLIAEEDVIDHLRERFTSTPDNPSPRA